MPFWFWIAGAAAVGIIGWALSSGSSSTPSPSPSAQSAPSTPPRQEQLERERLQRGQQYLEQQIEALRELLHRRDQQHRQELQNLVQQHQKELQKLERRLWWIALPAVIGAVIIELLLIVVLGRKGWQWFGRSWWLALRERLARWRGKSQPAPPAAGPGPAVQHAPALSPQLNAGPPSSRPTRRVRL